MTRRTTLHDPCPTDFSLSSVTSSLLSRQGRGSVRTPLDGPPVPAGVVFVTELASVDGEGCVRMRVFVFGVRMTHDGSFAAREGERVCMHDGTQNAEEGEERENEEKLQKREAAGTRESRASPSSIAGGVQAVELTTSTGSFGPHDTVRALDCASLPSRCR